MHAHSDQTQGRYHTHTRRGISTHTMHRHTVISPRVSSVCACLGMCVCQPATSAWVPHTDKDIHSLSHTDTDTCTLAPYKHCFSLGLVRASAVRTMSVHRTDCEAGASNTDRDTGPSVLVRAMYSSWAAKVYVSECVCVCMSERARTSDPNHASLSLTCICVCLCLYVRGRGGGGGGRERTGPIFSLYSSKIT
jgi:hypothetical protein